MGSGHTDILPRGDLRRLMFGVRQTGGSSDVDPSLVSGHSLRAGLATSAAAAGVQERVIAQTTGHRSMTVLRRYIREGNLFNENAASAVGCSPHPFSPTFPCGWIFRKVF